MFGAQPDQLALLLEEWFGFAQPERSRKLRIIADHRMHIQWQVGAVNRHVVLEKKPELPAQRTFNRAQARPEKAVMDEQQIDAALGRRGKGTRRGINRRADLADRARVLDLHAVERVRPIGALPDLQVVVGVTDDVAERGHLS